MLAARHFATKDFSMKKNVLLWALLLLGALALSGCSSSRYVVVTSDYAAHIAVEKPEIDPATDQFSFKDDSGRMVYVPRSELKYIKEVRQ